MRDFPQQYYETLPLHPQPIPMESFTSYLSRLARANGMGVVDLLLTASFPSKYFKHRLKEGFQALTGGPVLAFGALPELACCSEEALRATTFFHLEKKFGRFPRVQVIDVFLQGSVAPYLRYCPACLAGSRDPYYSLLWQFVGLSGCAQHNCRLLDRCGYCEQILPLLSDTPTVAVCPRCEGHLAKLTSPQLCDEEIRKVRRWTHDLEFLLTLYKKEDIENTKELLGQQYAHQRRIRGITIKQAAIHLQMSSRALQVLEKGKKVEHPRATLKSYLVYAEYLDLSFRDLYLSALSREDYSHIREDEWLMRAKVAIETLKSAEVPVTSYLVTQTMGVHESSLKNFPTVKALVDSFVREQLQISKTLKFQQRREKVIGRAKEAIEQLNKIGEPITLRSIANITKISGKTLSEYLRGTDLLKESMQIYYYDGTKRFKEREGELFQKVQIAIQELEALKKPIRLKNIGEMVGITLRGLYYYPSVRSLLAEALWSPNHNHSRDEDLVVRVREAIEKLELNGESVGYRTVSEMLGISPPILQRTLAVAELLETVRQDSLGLQKTEAVMVEKIFAAIKELEAQSEPVGYLSISKVTGISLKVLHRSVQVKEIIKEAIEKQQKSFEVEKRVIDAINYLFENDCNIKYKQISRMSGVPREVWWTIPNVRKRLEELAVLSEYEEELLRRVQDAIGIIESQEESVTLHKIWKTAHLSGKTIKGYPRVEAVLEPHKKTYHTTRKQRTQQREEELIVQVRSIIQEMQVLGQPVTCKQVSEKAGLSLQRLRQLPRVNAELEQVTIDRRQKQALRYQQREAELVKLLQEAIKETEALGEPVTQKTVLQRMTIPRTTFGYYPQARKVLRQLSRKNSLS